MLNVHEHAIRNNGIDKCMTLNPPIFSDFCSDCFLKYINIKTLIMKNEFLNVFRTHRS